ncbi:Putative dihydrofolate synthetase, partial [Tolypocladium paradoxum]
MHPSHLIVVCCHGIWLGGPSKGADESEWLIAPFQRGETGTFARHAEEGVRRLAQSRGDSVLMFSGGPTRNETEMSEAQSYAYLAAHNGYWGLLAAPVMDDDVVLEERALDSYHNVLLGLTRYHARFGRWPATLTLVGHAFKRPRLEAHCAAIGFPPGRVAF